MSESYEIRANNVQLKGLESRFEGLTADHEALSQQMRDTTNLAERGRLNRQLLEIDKELVQVAQAIDQLRERSNELAKIASVKLLEQPHSMACKLQAMLDILVPYELAITVNRETAYRRVCPPDWLRSMPVTLKGMLAELEDMQPDERDDPAILKFAAYLIADAQVPELLSKQLSQWAEEQSQDFSQLLQRSHQQTLQAEQAAANTSDRETDSYLMVVVNQSNSTDQQKDHWYSVKAWLIPDARNCQPKSGIGFETLSLHLGKLEDAEQSFTLDQIRGLLRDFLTESGKKCSLPALTIELFLPTTLLNQPIDSWVLEDESSFCAPVGIDYRVVLRSSERLREAYMARRGGFWKNKWRSLQTLSQQKDNEANSVFVCGDGEHPNRLYQQLRNENMIGLKVVCELLSFEKRGAFAVLQEAAIPVALWLRQTLPTCNCVAEIEQLLSCRIHEVPEAVKRKRGDAFEVSENPDSHIGHHLALLWEDVDRLPPDLTYYMP